MLNSDLLYSEISSRYGSITRARGCFLYTKSGVRLTDLYQEGGKAILGWGNSAAFTRFKNIINRGITGSFNTDLKTQFEKSISTLLASERKVFVFNSKSSAIKAALAISPENTSFWRPWNPVEIQWSEIPSIIVSPVFAWAQDFYFLAVKTKSIEIAENLQTDFSRGIKLPSPLYAAFSRSFYDIILAIQNRSERDWFLYDFVLTKYWTRKGPYLFPKMSEDDYTRFVFHCLEASIVISPDYNVPSIVPFGADRGIFTKLKNSPFTFEGGK